MLGDFWSTQSYSIQIGPAVPYPPEYGHCLLIVKFTRRRPLAPHGTASVILPMARSVIPAISHDLLDLRSMGNSHIPQRPVVVLRQGGDGLLDLALATPLRPSACGGAPDHGQPTWVDQSVSVDLARRIYEAVSRGWHPGSKCSSIDSVFTLQHRHVGTAEDETSEMDFRRSRLGNSWGRRAPTSPVIAVTAVVASPWSEAPYKAKPSRKNQNTDGQVASASAVAGLVAGSDFGSASELSVVGVNCSGELSRLSRGATREACPGAL